MDNLQKFVNSDSDFETLKNIYYELVEKLKELEEKKEEYAKKNSISNRKEKKHLEIAEAIDDTKNYLNNILNECISFDSLKDNTLCNKYGHIFVEDDKTLTCVLCGEYINSRDMESDAYNFLYAAAKEQGLFLDNALSKDIPFINVLLNEISKNSSEKEELEFDSDENWFFNEEYLGKDYIRSLLSKKLELAHMLDTEDYSSTWAQEKCLHYFTIDEQEMIIFKIKQDMLLIEASDSQFKELLLEECKVAIYEVIILTGVNIPSIYDLLNNESDRIAFVKAYYDISHKKYRKNIDYFKNNELKAIGYPCLTAHTDINTRILKMSKK